jgi:hypothetical protein
MDAIDSDERPVPSLGESRLQSIARYENFHPQSLACSHPLPHVQHHAAATTTLDEQQEPLSNRAQKQWTTSNPKSSVRTTTSLGAVAGSDGIALFRISQPHVPLLILSHTVSAAAATRTNAAHTAHTTTPLSTTAVTCLAFSPPSTRSPLYLASARGSGVLIWDVSGHSLSPLQCRLEGAGDHGPHLADGTTATAPSITSLTWLRHGGRLAATTATSACVWDVRVGGSSVHNRPSLRFGMAPSLTSSSSSSTKATSAPLYRQVACSDREEECALLDSDGVVRIFDIRILDRSTRSRGAVHEFQACHYAGVGLSFLPLASPGNERCWVTWGLDSPNADAVVKIWAPKVRSNEARPSAVAGDGAAALASPDDYWYMDTSPARPRSHKTSDCAPSSSTSSYRILATCSTSNLACARVCPAPVENAIVTVGLQSSSDTKEGSGWHADVWKLKFCSDKDDGAEDQATLERTVSFQSNKNTEPELCSIVGNDPRLFSLRASELAISSERTHGSENGLLLCSLTDNGYVLTHVRYIVDTDIVCVGLYLKLF